MKILILGYSDLAVRRLIPAIKKIKNVKFDVASRSKMEEKIGHDKWYRNYDKGIKSTDAKIIYISLVNSEHYKYALKSLKQNKNVIIDKPFTLSHKQTIKLLNLAKKKKLLISQAIVFNYHRQFNLIKKIIKNNRIGIDKIVMEFCIPRPKKNNFKLSKKLGGGCFNDMMPYVAAVNRFFLVDKFKYSKLIMKNSNKLNESFSVNTYAKKTEFFGLFSHNSEYKNNITFFSKLYTIDLSRFSAPPPEIDLIVKYKKKNKLKNILVKKDDTFKNFLYEYLKILKRKKITYYHNQIKKDSKFIKMLYKRKTVL